ncbi:hypothetical protein TNCT_713751 [Trichonephila clavata]|uniref:Uncharacterized protein n=1 Tax=Trichonephila clavata TaxID=2740835 RepID=A0A8X6HBW8_TRICU|nr:hypothetical protein TNCT_713751 [Trichonephila clavata]
MKPAVEFRLATGYDCLDMHLHLTKVFIDSCCMFYNHREPVGCTRLMHYPTLCSKSLWGRSWEDGNPMSS